jgi:hypothetical protein
MLISLLSKDYLLEAGQDLSMGEMMTVNFGAPNIFVTLWFELHYATNPPLGTRDGVTTSSKEQMRTSVRVLVQV